MKISKNQTINKYINYGLSFILAFILITLFVTKSQVDVFLNTMEAKTFDLRQKVVASSNYNKISKDIVLVTVDNPSYEYILDKYGEWPMPRNIYADFISYIEKQNPTAIAFDLMFVKSMKSKNNADLALVNAIKKNKNVFVSMNFEIEPMPNELPQKYAKKFAVNVKNDSNLDFSNVTFPSCRTILPQILENTKNVGMINAIRSEDGILRELPPFMVYKGNFYPNLALIVGKKYLEKTEGIKINNYHIDKNNNLILHDRIIPISKNSGAIINWYGQDFETIPFYKIARAMYGENKEKTTFDFKNKIIYFGVTATSQYDIKSVPISEVFPGVAVHANYINNIIENNFIKKADFKVNLAISIILALIVGLIGIKTTSALIASGSAILVSFGYVIFSYYVMKFFNIWIAIVLPITFIILTFTAIYIIKYILKSRDFEHQYKLATTDGLTELYNHRFFQEQMITQVENGKRYNSNFSLIMIDIDFFKKFNDSFGHQSGDAVLRQVSLSLKKNVRATDFVCRYGGEEMAIILPNTDKDEAIITAQKLCQVVAEKQFKLANSQEGTVTISLGVSTFPQDGDTPSAIIEKADNHLYFAKENGRNQVGY